MNIQIQLCGLFMLALLFIFYKSTKTLHLYKEKIFYRAMCIIIISLCLDILSLVSIFYRTHFPRLFVNFVCKGETDYQTFAEKAAHQSIEVVLEFIGRAEELK